MIPPRNKIRQLDDTTSEIELSGGKCAIVDNDDLFKLRDYRWYATRRGITWYAVANILASTGYRHTVIRMHKLILPHDEKHTDHINHNGLDNRKENLRPATPCLNGINNNARGIWRKKNGTWSAQITFEGKRYCRVFKHESDALAWRREFKSKITSDRV
jgi:hypothetical protein